MKKIFYFAIFAIALFCSCVNDDTESEDRNELTENQEKMLEDGWTFETPDEDMSEEYGVKPVYGIHDNYFDITIGKGCEVAIKIMDAKTDQCIRYIYVKENTTTTVQEIPQGTYYLKLAYGYDWMENDIDDVKFGKFTRNVSYEKSQETFDFGLKNSQDVVSYSLDINVVGSKLKNNFITISIDEEEFNK